MKKFFLFLLINFPLVGKDILQINVGSSGTQKMKIALCITGSDRGLNAITEILEKDLEFSGQFDIDRKYSKNFKPKNLTHFFEEGYPLVIVIQKGKNNKSIDWRIYDTFQAESIFEKTYIKKDKYINSWAHNIADDIWPNLAGHEGLFSSKLVYSESIPVFGRKALKYIYICDYDGSNKQLLVDTPTINIAARWNNDKENPLILYSECTSSNIRLIAVNMNMKKRIVATSDGLNMQTNFNLGDEKVVFCSSRSGTSQIYYYEYDKKNKKIIIKRITNNKGNNVAPILLENGDIIFCSDFETGYPQVYYLHNNNVLEGITKASYCACPSYTSKDGGKIAYSKIVNSVMQIFIYDINTKKHEQITFDNTNKEEMSWSPCGNYLVFSVGLGGYSRIAIINLLTKELKYITPKDKNISYPSWSPKYDIMPKVKN